MDLRPSQISLSLINARSIINKTVPFQQYITEKDTDISIITETWIKTVDDPNTIKEIPPLGYKICSHPRKTNRKGGVLHWYIKALSSLMMSQMDQNHILPWNIAILT